MKKILFILSLVLLLLTSCTNPHRVVGDEYIVRKVEYFPSNPYRLTYKIMAVPVHPKANRGTFDGNKMRYYTDAFYSVGDTIKISNLRK